MAIEFDRVDDRVTCGSSNFTSNATPVTFSFWIKPGSNWGVTVLDRVYARKGTSTTRGMFILPGTTPAHPQIGLYIDGATLLANWSAWDTIALNTWQNVIISWDGTTHITGIDIYINGGSNVATDIGSDGVSLDSLAGNTHYIGNWEALTRPFGGQLSEFAIWNTVLTSAERTKLATTSYKGMPLKIQPSNLKLYLPMDDGTPDTTANNSTIADHSGNGNNGTGNYGAGSGLLWRSETILPYRKIGLNINDGSNLSILGDTSFNSHKLRFRKGTATYGLPLVSVGSSYDRGLRLFDGVENKAVAMEPV